MHLLCPEVFMVMSLQLHLQQCNWMAHQPKLVSHLHHYPFSLADICDPIQLHTSGMQGACKLNQKVDTGKVNSSLQTENFMMHDMYKLTNTGFEFLLENVLCS